MRLIDQELLDFDTRILAHWDEARVEQALRETPELYRNHLVIARWLDDWIEGLEDQADHTDDRVNDGFIAALREVRAHLRQADLVPAGILYEETVGHG